MRHFYALYKKNETNRYRYILGGFGGSQIRYTESEGVLGELRGHFRKFQSIFDGFQRHYGGVSGGFEGSWVH